MTEAMMAYTTQPYARHFGAGPPALVDGAGTRLAEAPFRPIGARRQQALETWLADYILQPHPGIGRQGVVCPFVQGSLRRRRLVALEYVTGERHLDVSELLTSLTLMRARFTAWSEDRRFDSVVMTFTDPTDEAFPEIDMVHEHAKDEAVRHGLMLGQFHPRCNAPAARNVDFPVNRAPMPMVVMRNMAPHDILFLQGNEDWVCEHVARFHDDPQANLYYESLGLHTVGINHEGTQR